MPWYMGALKSMDSPRAMKLSLRFSGNEDFNGNAPPCRILQGGLSSQMPTTINRYQPLSSHFKPFPSVPWRGRCSYCPPRAASQIALAAEAWPLKGPGGGHMLGHISRTLKPNKNYIKTKSHHHTIEKDGSTYCEQNIFTASCAWAPLMSSRVAPRLTTCYHNFQLQTPNGSKWSHLEAPTWMVSLKDLGK